MGGLARSTFLRILAEVTGRSVLVAEDVEAGQRGAALMAGVACGLWGQEAACSLLPVPFRPVAEPGHPSLYETVYRAFLEADAR